MSAFQYDPTDRASLEQLHADLQIKFAQLKSENLNLDLTRCKPSADQLALSNKMDGILGSSYITESGTDTRNYGGLDGIIEAKTFFADVMEVCTDEILIGGNSSLTLMYQSVLFAYLFGFNGPESAWKNEGNVKFLCPIPGYDRHFSICEELGIEMITIRMNENGPDMDQVESLIKNDTTIKGMWCVPRFSNPSGIVYSDETVDRIAALGKIASSNFRVFWDNAYAVHFIEENAQALRPIMAACKKYNTEDSVLQFGSTSKITFAGAGLAYMCSSPKNLTEMKKHLGISSIGPDKINQLRHLKFFGDKAGLLAHMKAHAELLKPRFAAVLETLDANFSDSDALSWTSPQGGYFVSVDTQEGLAQKVVSLAAELGVKLTPEGATFPYGNDENNTNIRIAPSFPTLEDTTHAMDVFVLCVKLATVEKALCA